MKEKSTSRRKRLRAKNALRGHKRLSLLIYVLFSDIAFVDVSASTRGGARTRPTMAARN